MGRGSGVSKGEKPSRKHAPVLLLLLSELITVAMVLMKREALMESPSWITLVRGFVFVVRSRLTSARASATGTGYTCHHHHVLSDKIESKKFVYLFHLSTLTHMKFYTKPSHTWTVPRLGCLTPGLSLTWMVSISVQFCAPMVSRTQTLTVLL